MAGIGFRIQKILAGGTYLDIVKAYFYSAIIFSGPWLMSILTIFALSYFTPTNIPFQDLLIFRASIVYIFAFSLIVVGFLHLSLTRYLSDRLYLKEEEALVPIFNSAVLATLIVQVLIGSLAMKFLPVEFPIKFFIVMIYLTISVLWVIMIFLTTLRDYQAIAFAFMLGAGVAIGGALFFGRLWGLVGYFLGYFVGHLLIVVLLSARIFIEFDSKRFFDWDILSFLRENKVLILLGVFYNLAIWIDKIIFWFSTKAMNITGFLYSYPEYESATFFAYLTIIPALSIFLIRIETDFYRTYQTFYTQVLEKGTLANIVNAKKNMIESLRKNIVFVLIGQGLFSLLVIIFAPTLAEILHLKAIQIPIFRITALGAFLHSMFLIVLIVILYFDFKTLALKVTFTFLMVTAVATYVTSYLPLPFIGYGYFAGVFTALAAAFYGLDRKLHYLEYFTFALQPLGQRRSEDD